MTLEPPGADHTVGTPDDRPLDREALREAIERLPVGQRVEAAFSWQLLACVSLGFARVAVPPLRQRAADIGHHPLSGALTHLATCITQKAVLDAAATYDQAGEGASSLASALTLISRYLKESESGSAADREAARQLVAGLRDSVITHKSAEMKAVQYWRNKWAAHRSVDPEVDPWAWDHPVDFTVIEFGLEQMRIAFHEFAVLLTQLPELASLQAEARRIDDHTVRAGLDFEGTASWPIDFTLNLGESQANQFLDRVMPALTIDPLR